MERFQKAAILRDLEKKMVFIAGPRQAGKTWLAQDIATSYSQTVYLNYDLIQDRRTMNKMEWSHTTELLILDELHKMPMWKNYLKGLYDTKTKSLRILVTGSARLEIFRRVGDSLAGRYFLHHLLPFSPAELHKVGEVVDLNRFMVRGGFPEPYLALNDIEAKRWQQQYIDSILREELLAFADIQNLRQFELVIDLLRSRVGSPISYQSIAEDVGIAPNTVKKYIQLLETFYIIFRLTPYSTNIARSLIKEPKIYFYDTALVKGDPGAIFENLMAVCLLKHVFGKIDYEGEGYALYYIRTKDKEEIDFAIAHDDQLELLVEAKYADGNLSKTLVKYHEKYHIPAVQVVKELRQGRYSQGIEIQKAIDFLSELAL